MGRRRLKHEWSAQPDVPEKASRMKKESRSEGEVEGREIPAEQREWKSDVKVKE